jgi:hypothetical protein
MIPTETPSPQLIVFLENAGRAADISLPAWASRLLDWSVEEYAKGAIWLQARRHYRRIVVLEDERATAAELWDALLQTGNAVVDVLMLVHGQAGYACGYGEHQVGEDFFTGMHWLQQAAVARFRLRAVYQMNCYGHSLAAQWLALGAQAVNGAVGVNWLPEPSLSVFLNTWLGGGPFGEAVTRSYGVASRLLGTVWRASGANGDARVPHPKIASSQMLVFGDAGLRKQDVT